jgi:phosphatidylserine decarboxylase
MMKFLIKLCLPVVSLPVFSRIWGRVVRIRRPRFLVKRIIERYRKSYGIDMDEYEGETGDYHRLADFFVRKLDPEKRPLVPDDGCIVSPSDGVLTEVETIFEDKAKQIKGKYYSISELLGTSLDFSAGLHVAVIYLSPSNYHRYHYPVTGKIQRYLHTGARLFPVNRVGLSSINNLFIRNERIVTEIIVNESPVYVTAVGATFVGSIKMEFIESTSPSTRKKRNQWQPVDLEVRQLEEMGRFDMGSTIVLVLPRKMAEPIDSVKGKPVRVGQPIFRFINA